MLSFVAICLEFPEKRILKLFYHTRGLYRVFWDTGYWPIFLMDTGIVVFFILGYGIYSGNLGYGLLEFNLGYELN